MKKISLILIGLFSGTILFAQDVNRTKAPLPGPVPQIKLQDPAIFTLSNGITVIVVTDKKVPQISVDYAVDAGPIKEGAKAGVTSVVAAMIQEGTKLHSKAVFDSTIDQIGATYSGGSVTALSNYFEQAFGLFTEALQQPLLSESSFKKVQNQFITGAKANEKSAESMSERAVNALLYGKTNPLGEFSSATTYAGLTLQDVKDAYQNYYTPSRGILTFVGDITPEKAKALSQKYLGAWTGKKVELPNLPLVASPKQTEIDIVNVPNAVQSEIKVANLVNLSKSNPDFFPVILANEILGGGAEGRLFKNLREKHGFTYGAYSSVGSGRWQSTFMAQAAVRNDKTDSAVVEFLKEIKDIRTLQPTIEELNIAKALYNGQFALGMENPARPASYAKNILLEKLPKDFYKKFLQKINAVTPADIQRVAQKYFNYSNARIIITGKASDIKDKLSQLGYPVTVYNIDIDTLKQNTATTSSVKAKDLLNNYYTAIGGLDNLKAIKSIQLNGKMSVQGMELIFEEKKLAPNWDMATVSMGGNPVMKNVFKGTSGYEMQMGKKKDLTAALLKSKNEDDKGIIEELYYLQPEFGLSDVTEEDINDTPQYKITVKLPSGKTKILYFDQKTNLITRAIQSEKGEDGVQLETAIDYSDYRTVGDIKYPFSIVTNIQTPQGSQELPIVLDTVVLNSGVTEADF